MSIYGPNVEEVVTTVPPPTSDTSDLVHKKGDIMTGDLDMDSNKIVGISNPVDQGDAVNLNYLQYRLRLVDQDNVNIDGTNSMDADLHMGGNKLIGLGDPVDDTDAVNKRYVDATDVSGFINKSGDTMSGVLDMGDNKITGLPKCTAAGDAVDYSYLNYRIHLVDNKNLDVDGTNKMEANLNMDGNKVIGLSDPVEDTDAVNKNYVDDAGVVGPTGPAGPEGPPADVSGLVGKRGDTMTGDLNMDGNKITGISTAYPPLSNSQAASWSQVNKLNLETLSYVNGEIDKKLNTDGSNLMTSVLDMGGHRIIKVDDPIHDYDASNKKYVVDSLDSISNINNELTVDTGSAEFIFTQYGLSIGGGGNLAIGQAPGNGPNIDIIQHTSMPSKFDDIPGGAIRIRDPGSSRMLHMGWNPYNEFEFRMTTVDSSGQPEVVNVFKISRDGVFS